MPVTDAPWFAEAVTRLARDLREHHAPTVAHTHGTAALARGVAERLGLDPLEATEVELVAVLHEAAKEAVAPPDGHLNRRQRAFVRTRSATAGELLTEAAGLDQLATAVRAVHERWDGRGHPDGLADTAIPVAARIVAAVAAWLAMTSDRPHRPAIPAGEARVKLAIAAGGRFDPQVVEALLTELRAGAEDGPGPAGLAGDEDIPSPL